MSDKQSNEPSEICVYYNSACPVCKAGIEYQKKKALRHDIFWGDIHSDNRLAEKVSPDLEKLRKYLHVTDDQGQVYIGIDAFIAIWRRSDNQAWLAKVFSLPVLNPISKAGYFLFATMLYRWNRWNKHW